MLFRDVIDQQPAKTILTKMVKANRIPHALLLLGAQGSGSLPLALATTQFILCTDRQDDDACGHCAACIKAAKHIHPDVHFVFPTVGSKGLSDEFLKEWRLSLEENPYLNSFQWLEKIGGEGKQGNITAAECNQIIKKLSLKTFESDYKILVLWLPEYLGNQGNRLLKMIEEPPGNTIFLLVAEDQEQILTTILSRCQLIKVNALSDEAVTDGLKQRASISLDQARAIAFLAAGDFNEALSILEQSAKEGTEGRGDFFIDWLRKCYLGNGIEMARWVEKFAATGREFQKLFLKYGLHFIREFLYLKVTGNEHVRLLPTELETAKRMTKVLDFEQVEMINHLFSDCAYHVERNANPKALFLDASIRLHRIMQKTET